MKLYMFRAVPLPIRRVFTVHSALIYVTQVWRRLSSRTRMELVLFWFSGFILLLACIPTSNRIKPVPSWSCSKAVFKLVWHIPVPSVQWINSWWWAEELSEICRVSCWSKFGKLVHLVGFIIKKVDHKLKNFLLMYETRNVTAVFTTEGQQLHSSLLH
jgi:hypothetical protein